jgi:hypothetical protein
VYVASAGGDVIVAAVALFAETEYQVALSLIRRPTSALTVHVGLTVGVNVPLDRTPSEPDAVPIPVMVQLSSADHRPVVAEVQVAIYASPGSVKSDFAITVLSFALLLLL